MKPLGPELEHYWLALGMARTAGAGLEAAMEEGRLDHGSWAATVQRCRSCDWAADCPSWLAEHDHVERAPDTCLNTDLFARLRAGGTAADTGRADPAASDAEA